MNSNIFLVSGSASPGLEGSLYLYSKREERDGSRLPVNEKITENLREASSSSRDRDLRSARTLHEMEVDHLNWAFCEAGSISSILKKNKGLFPLIFLIDENHEMRLGIENPFELLMNLEEYADYRPYLQKILEEKYYDSFVSGIEKEFGDEILKNIANDEIVECLIAVASNQRIDESLLYDEIIGRTNFIKGFRKTIQLGHPSLAHQMDENGVIIEGKKRGFIGGELEYSDEKKAWVLTNKSGRYGIPQNSRDPLEQYCLNMKYLVEAYDQIRLAGVKTQVLVELFFKSDPRTDEELQTARQIQIINDCVNSKLEFEGSLSQEELRDLILTSLMK